MVGDLLIKVEISVDKVSTRFVIGLRGTTSNGWDWEAAITNVKRKKC